MFAFIDFLEPLIKISASLVGVFSFSVYYYTTKDIDWGETDEANE